MSGEKIRVGVVGMGKMGLLHCGLLNVLPGAELGGVCEPVPLMRRMLKKVLPKVPVVESVSDLLKFDLDALFITTPTKSHYSVAKEALESCIAMNLFVEKPLSVSYEDSENLCDLISGKGVGMVGYVRRFMVTFMKAKELLDAGAIGRAVTFSVNMNSSDFFGITDPAISIARGGVMRDLGCYPIDLILWYFGQCNIDSASSESVTGSGAVDVARFALKGDGSVPSGKVSVSWCSEGYRMPELEFLVVGSKGNLLATDDYVRLEVGDKTSTFYRLNLGDNVPFWLGSPEYYREDECFVKSVEQNSVAQPSFESAALVELAIEEVEKKAKSNE